HRYQVPHAAHVCQWQKRAHNHEIRNHLERASDWRVKRGAHKYFCRSQEQDANKCDHAEHGKNYAYPPDHFVNSIDEFHGCSISFIGRASSRSGWASLVVLGEPSVAKLLEPCCTGVTNAIRPCFPLGFSEPPKVSNE